MQIGIGLNLTGGGGAKFDPLSAWAGGGKGLWLDPSDINTGFETSVGQTPHTATGQPTGLRLDKRLGLVRGSNIVTNGTFDSSTTTGWTGSGASLSVVGGRMRVTTTAAANGWGYQALTTVVGKWYEVTFDFVSGTSAASFLNVGTAHGDSTNGQLSLGTSSGSKRMLFVATATTTYLAFVTGSALGVYSDFDNIVTTSLNGNHVSQATAGSRPEFSIISGIYSDYRDGSDDHVTTAAFSAGTLTSDMTLLMAVNRETTAQMILANAGAPTTVGRSLGYVASGAPGTTVENGGSAWTAWVNGVQVGGTATTTAGEMHTAIGSGSWKIVELRNLDLSASTQFSLSGYPSYMVAGDDGGVMLFPSNSAILPNMRRWLGAKAGLSL